MEVTHTGKREQKERMEVTHTGKKERKKKSIYKKGENDVWRGRRRIVI